MEDGQSPPFRMRGRSLAWDDSWLEPFLDSLKPYLTRPHSPLPFSAHRHVSQDVVMNEEQEEAAAAEVPISRRLPSRTGTKRGADVLPAPRRVPQAKRELQLVPPVHMEEVLYVFIHENACNAPVSITASTKLEDLGYAVNVVYTDAGSTKSVRWQKNVVFSAANDDAVRETLTRFVESSKTDRATARKASLIGISGYGLGIPTLELALDHAGCAG